MPLFLLLAFVVVPLVELAVIQQVAEVLTLPWTLVLLLVDSVAGALLVRREGSRTWQAVRGALTQGRLPGDEILQGAFVLGGGALLLTPGFVTDLVGLLLVAPPTRAALARVLRLRFVPVPIQAGEAVWNGVRRRRPEDAEAAPVIEDVEVLSVERELPPEDA